MDLLEYWQTFKTELAQLEKKLSDEVYSDADELAFKTAADNAREMIDLGIKLKIHIYNRWSAIAAKILMAPDGVKLLWRRERFSPDTDSPHLPTIAGQKSLAFAKIYLEHLDRFIDEKNPIIFTEDELSAPLQFKIDSLKEFATKTKNELKPAIASYKQLNNENGLDTDDNLDDGNANPLDLDNSPTIPVTASQTTRLGNPERPIYKLLASSQKRDLNTALTDLKNSDVDPVDIYKQFAKLLILDKEQKLLWEQRLIEKQTYHDGSRWFGDLRWHLPSLSTVGQALSFIPPEQQPVFVMIDIIEATLQRSEKLVADLEGLKRLEEIDNWAEGSLDKAEHKKNEVDNAAPEKKLNQQKLDIANAAPERNSFVQFLDDLYQRFWQTITMLSTLFSGRDTQKTDIEQAEVKPTNKFQKRRSPIRTKSSLVFTELKPIQDLEINQQEESPLKHESPAGLR